jgi:hypothetical protein
VDEIATKLEVWVRAAAARAPTARRWPRLEELAVVGAPALELADALACVPWSHLRRLVFDSGGDSWVFLCAFAAPAAHALAAALRRMPRLGELQLKEVRFSVGALAALFVGWTPDATPQLRSLTLRNVGLTPAAAGALAASGWRLEELDVSHNASLGDAGVAALVGAPPSALRRRSAGAAAVAAPAGSERAEAPWPLAVLNVSWAGLGVAGVRALASRRWPRLRLLDVRGPRLNDACVAALALGEWPALEELRLGDAVFPALLALDDARRWAPALRTLVHDAV